MNNCDISFELLSKAVSAAIIDTYGGLNERQLFTHWAVRGLRKLYSESLPLMTEKALLPISPANTVSLPHGFEYETFVGVIRKGKKVRIYPDKDLVNEKYIKRVSPNFCSRCNQDLSICNSLMLEEEPNIIFINGTAYQEDVIKKIYPNGDYMLEKNTPFLDKESDTVIFRETKRLIVQFDMEICGCLKDCEENTEKLKQYCPLGYALSCDDCDDCDASETVSYRVMPDVGFIFLSSSLPNEEVYVEYASFLPKMNGRYVIPKIAFEAVVEWVKFKAIQSKSNIPMSEKILQKNEYKEARRNMEKVIAKRGLSLDLIMKVFSSVPRINLSLEN